jgi:predicted transcriptional regulator
MIRFFKRPHLGPLEQMVLEILWDRGESNVHDVAKALTKPLAYTTVMTTLDRLYKKGLLARRKIERAFVYAPACTRLEWERRRAGEFFSDFLGGSKSSGTLLVSCLVDAVGQRDAALLDELEKKIRSTREELEKRKKR